MSTNPHEWLPPSPALQCESIATGWKERSLRGTRNRALSVVANALIALRHAPEWESVLHFNESSLATVAKVAPPFETRPDIPFTWANEHDVLTAAWLPHQGISANKEIAAQAVHAIAREHSFHPIREYLDSLKWDGTKRIDNWLTLYLGTEPSEYARAVGAKFLIGGVARIYKPGVGKHLNFSAISKLAAAQQGAVPFEPVNKIQLGAMPLPAYRFVHPGSVVTPQQLAALKQYLKPATLNKANRNYR
jgi:hypothetical protein